MRLPVQINELAPGIYHARFESLYCLLATAIRLHGVNFHSTPFDHEESLDRWARLHGNYTYFSDCVGLMLDYRQFAQFKTEGFQPYWRREQALMDLVEGFEEPYMVICTFQDKDPRVDLSTIRHELAHAFYELDDRYRRDVLKTMRRYGIKRLLAFLKKRGYSHDSLHTEANAYLVEGETVLRELGFVAAINAKLVSELQDLYMEKLVATLGRDK